MKELITINKTDYINLAIDLAKNPKKLKKIKDDLEINVNNSSLFDSSKFTKNLEDLYLKILKN